MMKKSSCYIYYSSLSQKIIKLKFLHVLFILFENFCIIILIIDSTNMLYGKESREHFKILNQFNLNNYINQTEVLCIILFFFLIIYIFYFLSHILLSFKYFQRIFINFYEIFHIRILTFFYLLALFSLHNIQLIIGYFISVIYFIISLIHIFYFHLPIYSIENVRFVYDSLSSHIDSIELTTKTLLILANTLSKKYYSFIVYLGFQYI